jgi:hypothetical protein
VSYHGNPIPQSAIDGLVSALSGKAAAAHTHDWADITGEPTTLAGYGLGDVTAAGIALLDDANAAAQRSTLGLGTLATQNGTFSLLRPMLCGS